MPKNPLSAILDDPLVSGAEDLASRFGRYVGSGDALRDSAGLAVRVAPDLLRGGPSRVLMKHVAEPMAASLTKDFKANPVRTVAENLPVVGGVMSALEAKDLRQKALEARARGDMEGYRRYSEAAAAAAGMTAVGMIPVPGAAGAKTAAKVGVKAAERDAVRDVSRLAEKYGVEVPGVSRDNHGGPIKGYHGSPHEFDRFDMSKLGTGEGANVYGEGLYIAEHPAVARAYRSGLAGPPNAGSVTFRNRPILVKGERGEAWGMNLPGVKDVAPKDVAADLLSRYGNVGDVIAQYRDFADETRARWAQGADAPNIIAWNPRVSRSGREANMRMELELADTHERLADFLEKYGQDFKVQAPGYTYEVDINASPEQFLNWEKTLSEQSPLVRGALEDFAAKQVAREKELRDAMLARGLETTGLPLSSKRVEELSRPLHPEELTGQRIYYMLNQDANTTQYGEKGAAARRSLLDKGVVGTTYRDQGSRLLQGEGIGTNNFVVFDDELLDITNRYSRGGKV